MKTFLNFEFSKKKLELFKYAETKPSEVENRVYVAVSSDKVLRLIFFNFFFFDSKKLIIIKAINIFSHSQSINQPIK